MNTTQVPHGQSPDPRFVDRHKRAANMLGFALTSAAEGTWQDFAIVIAKRLDLRERQKLAEMVLITLPSDALGAALAATGRGAGFPTAPFGDVLPYAALWAAAASRDEIHAYLVAAFKALDPEDRREFLAHATRGGRP